MRQASVTVHTENRNGIASAIDGIQELLVLAQNDFLVMVGWPQAAIKIVSASAVGGESAQQGETTIRRINVVGQDGIPARIVIVGFNVEYMRQRWIFGLIIIGAGDHAGGRNETQRQKRESKKETASGLYTIPKTLDFHKILSWAKL